MYTAGVTASQRVYTSKLVRSRGFCGWSTGTTILRNAGFTSLLAGTAGRINRARAHEVPGNEHAPERQCGNFGAGEATKKKKKKVEGILNTTDIIFVPEGGRG